MKTTKMLKKNYEFKQVLTKGKCYTGDYIKVFILKNHKNINFLGLAISTKYGKAVQRNKLKRFLRENYKNLEQKLIKGYSILFLVNKNVNTKDIDFSKVKNDMVKIFNKAKII